MKVAYKTDVGKKRSHNEDSILVDESMNIFLLADGMGGHKAGEVASDLAVKECYACLKENVHKAGREEDISRLLTGALFKAHNTIKAKSKTDINLEGMGTTLLQMLVIKNQAHVCHVGDSRAYLLRGKLNQITKDHTEEIYFVKKDMLELGYPPLQKVRVLTQAVGNSEMLVPELQQVKLKTGDILLLCSDGLTDMLSDGEIEAIIQRYRENLHAATDHLIKEANTNGGVDNISVILMEFE